ncbi:hypothetical protein ABZ467_35380 [Streptomyces sp. NPDC005727]|uniref:hypothetical protein n=1 Tax=Streptomyces sp. NPDC005727 TaxID=3157053 RepID=UPI0033D58507
MDELHDRLSESARRAEDRDHEPSAAVIDPQSVKADTTFALTSRGFDAGKKINGRKRHLRRLHRLAGMGQRRKEERPATPAPVKAQDQTCSTRRMSLEDG